MYNSVDNALAMTTELVTYYADNYPKFGKPLVVQYVAYFMTHVDPMHKHFSRITPLLHVMLCKMGLSDVVKAHTANMSEHLRALVYGEHRYRVIQTNPFWRVGMLDIQPGDVVAVVSTCLRDQFYFVDFKGSVNFIHHTCIDVTKPL